MNFPLCLKIFNNHKCDRTESQYRTSANALYNVYIQTKNMTTDGELIGNVNLHMPVCIVTDGGIFVQNVLVRLVT